MKTDWNHLVPHGIPGKREDGPRTLRFTREIGAAIDALAKERDIDFTTAVLGLLKVALEGVSVNKPPSSKLKRAS